MEKENHYRPLPKCVTIAPSDVEGLGLHATEAIGSYKNLGVSHIQEDTFPDGWIRTPLGGFINHSDNPNTELVSNIDYHNNLTTKELFTIKPIQAGEELVVKYTLYNPEN
jgi:SET domain-containing protein